MSAPDTIAPAGPDRPRRRRRRLAAILVWTFTGMVAALAVLILLGHWAVTGGLGARMVAARLNGVSIPGAGEIRVSGFGGDLLDLVSADTIQLVDEDGPWLTLTDISLDWAPRALTQRVVQIEQLRAGEAVLHRLPRATPREPGRRSGGSGLPDASLVLDALVIDRLAVEEDAFGVAGEFVLTGAAALRREGGGHVDLNAVEAETLADALSLAARLEPDGRVTVEAAAGSAADGLVATLLGAPAGDAARLELDAEGTQDSGTGAFALSFGGEPAGDGDAQWDAGTIRATAHVEAARWRALQGLAQSTGPTADIVATLSGYRSETPVFDMTVDTQRLDLALTGAPPTGENLREQGLAVQAEIADLGAWTEGTVLADSATFDGRVQRSDSGFGAEGELGARNFGAFSIRAEALSGPATLRFADGVLDFSGELQGSGGGGAAQMVADWVGPRPLVTLAGQFRAEDRVLEFQTLTVQSGAASAQAAIMIALRPEAQPRLTIDGSVQGLALAPLLPNIQGALGGDFSVTRARRAAPLEIAASGEASGVSGAPEILAPGLGTNPRFEMQGNFAEGVLTIERGVVEGPGLRVGAQGTLAGEAGLDIALEAALQGPLPLPGGIELAGELMGRGAVTGPLQTPAIQAQLFAERLDIAGASFLTPVAELDLTLEGGLSGDVVVTGASDFGEARAAARIERTEAGGIVAPDLTLRWADIAADGRLDTRADGLLEGMLTLRKDGEGQSPWPGTLDGEVRLYAADGRQAADAELTAERIEFPEREIWIDALDLTAEGPLERLEFALSADGLLRSLPVQARSDGVFAATPAGRRAEFGLEVQAGNVTVTAQEPVVAAFGGGTRELHARLGVDTGRIAIDYTGGADGALIVLDIRDAPMRIIEAAQREPRLDGVLNTQLRLDTRGGALTGEVTGTLRNARALDAEQDRIDMDLDGAIANGRFTGALDMRDSGGLRARIEGALPVERGEGLLPVRVDAAAPLSGQLSADGAVDTISSILMTPEQRLAGTIRLDARLTGALNDPRIQGDGALNAARFDDGVSGLVLDQLEIHADFSNDRIRVTNLSATDGEGGTLSGSGAAQSTDGAWSGEVTAAAQNFRAVNRVDAQARLSGDLAFTVTPERRALSGALTVENGEFAPPASAPVGVRTLEVTEINLPPEERDDARRRRARTPIELDVSIRSDRRVFIRSANIDAELSVDAHIGGTAGDVQVTGEANVVRGDADLAGRRFTFESGRVRFNGEPLDATLDFVAVREAADLDAIIRVTGTPREPRIALESRPPLPQDEVLAQVLFGRSASDLSALEAAQLASGLASMAGGGGFDALGNIRSGLGLDRLAFGQDSRTGEAQISGGRYLTDDVYLEVTTGTQGRAAAQVEWQALSDFAIISRFGSEDDTSISVRWRTTY